MEAIDKAVKRLKDGLTVGASEFAEIARTFAAIGSEKTQQRMAQTPVRRSRVTVVAQRDVRTVAYAENDRGGVDEVVSGCGYELHPTKGWRKVRGSGHRTARSVLTPVWSRKGRNLLRRPPVTSVLERSVPRRKEQPLDLAQKVKRFSRP